jgi:hypothetical protein
MLTDTSTDQNSNLDIEHIFSRCTVRTIDPNSGEREAAAGVELYEIPTDRSSLLTLL